MCRHKTPAQLRPVSSLTYRCGDKQVHYDQVWILDRLVESCHLNRRAVRVCRPPMPGEGHEGRVLVQCLIDGLKVFVKGDNLCEATGDERRLLSAEERASLELFDIANRGRVGVDQRTGGVLFTSDPDS